MIGCAKEIGGDLYCNDNHMTSLVGSPDKLGQSFICKHNDLRYLKGCPSIINGNFDCSDCFLENVKDGPKVVMGNYIMINNEKVEAPDITANDIRNVTKVGGRIFAEYIRPSMRRRSINRPYPWWRRKTVKANTNEIQ